MGGFRRWNAKGWTNQRNTGSTRNIVNMQLFTLETILIENEAEEPEAAKIFCSRAKEKGFSEAEIQEGLKARILEWRNYKLILIDS